MSFFGSCVPVTCALVRPNGKAGNEIPEQLLDLNTNRRNLYNGLVARFGLDLNATADLQNILDFFDDVAPGPAHRERRKIRLLERNFPRLLAPSTAYLPPSLPLGRNSIIYLSEVIPRSLGQRKRLELLTLFRTKASYVPACINLASGLNYGIQYHVRTPPRLAMLQPNLPLGPNRQGWPSNSLPLEVFNIISNYLPRDVLQNMRLVNREFESKISQCFISYCRSTLPARDLRYDGPARQISRFDYLGCQRKRQRAAKRAREKSLRWHEDISRLGPLISKGLRWPSK